METAQAILDILSIVGSMIMAACGLWHSLKERWAQAAFYMAFAAWLGL